MFPPVVSEALVSPLEYSFQPLEVPMSQQRSVPTDATLSYIPGATSTGHNSLVLSAPRALFPASAPAWASPLLCSARPLAAPGCPHQSFQSGRQGAVVVRGLVLQAVGIADPLQLRRVLHVNTLCREGGCGQDQGPVREPKFGVRVQ